MDKRKIAFPRFTHYNLVIKYFVEQGLGQTYIMQPAMTKRTMELGSKYSPDTACTPFKSTLGSIIEAMDSGADTIIMTFGLCRLGYFGEIQENILKDLGYECEFINMSEYTTGKKKDYLKVLKKVAPNAKAVRMAATAVEALKMAEYLDEIEADYYKICGFEKEQGKCRYVLDCFHRELGTAANQKEIENAYHKAKDELRKVPLIKEERPLRVGIIGEYFTAQDSFSNLDLEQKLADLHVEVYRWMNVSHRNIHYGGEKNLNVSIRNFDTFEMGPTSTANIWCAKKYAEEGFDGIIHVKSAGCTPEIDIMPVLQNIGKQYKIPILYLTFDAQTSDTGLMTRIEAFYDMINMRKKVV